MQYCIEELIMGSLPQDSHKIPWLICRSRALRVISIRLQKPQSTEMDNTLDNKTNRQEVPKKYHACATFASKLLPKRQTCLSC